MHSLQHKDTSHADVIVIGAGVLGTFHAYYAVQMGFKTILIERNAFPSDASTRNFGMVVQTIVETEGEWPTFARASREIYKSIQQELNIGVQSNGSLYIASTEIERTVLEEFARAFSPTYNCSYLMLMRRSIAIHLFKHLTARVHCTFLMISHWIPGVC